MLISDDEQYKKYLNEVNALIALDPDLDTPQGERLSLLALAIKEYETKYYFFDKPTPIEAIRFRMDEQGLIQNDLIPYIGSKSKVSEILSGKRNLTIAMIRSLSANLGIPLEILIQDTEQNTHINIKPEKVDWKTFPLSEMTKRGWIVSTKNKNEEQKKQILLDFFKPLGDFSQLCVLWRHTLHNGNEKNSITSSQLAWIAKVMMLANEINMERYDKSAITTDYLRELSRLSQFNQGPLLASEKLAQSGIKLIFLKNLSKSKVDGVCFLDGNGNPVIGMSLRYNRIDYFWYTLLHEMAHVYKHLNEKNQFIDNLDIDSSMDFQEKEADKIARESLIPSSAWRHSNISALNTASSIKIFAKKNNVHPAIVAGRIRFETKNFKKYSGLVGQGEMIALLGNELKL